MRIYKTTDFTLPWYDFSTLSALASCPRKGVIQYRHNKHMPEHRTSQALSAGSAMHKFFAAWNGFEKPELLASFDKQALENMYAASSLAMSGEARLNFALEVFNDYEESNMDKKRSLTNLQKSAIYWSEMQTHKWDIIAVEQPFDVTLEFVTKPETVVEDVVNSLPKCVRYVGLIDAIAQTTNGTIFSVEYKTTGRITDAYRSQWILSPQLTGYNLALKALFGEDKVASYSVLEAITIPIPYKPGTAPVHMREQFGRGSVQFEVFESFVRAGVKTAETVDEPWNVYANPGACNNYNSVCQYLPFCSVDVEDREYIFKNELVEQVWNPIGVV